MCGRAAYSARAISAAALSLGATGSGSDGKSPVDAASLREYISTTDATDSTNHRHSASTGATSIKQEDIPTSTSEGNNNHINQISIDIKQNINDNPNMSPGNSALVFRCAPSDNNKNAPRSTNSSQHDQSLECTEMIWGLLPQHGTFSTPHSHPTHSQFSASPHYKMFNARSETVYEKRSFAGLLKNGQTCIFAAEGYYEWTFNASPADNGNVSGSPKKALTVTGDKRKQPYYACQKDHQPLLLAGVWSCVKTGRRINNNTQDETITTFAILTTDAHPKFSWIHHRQPVLIWDSVTANEWLKRPCPKLLEQIRHVPASVTELSPWETRLLFYPVSKKMNDGKYRGDDCTVEAKLGKIASVKSFFTSGSSGAGDAAKKKANVENKNIASKPNADNLTNTCPQQSKKQGYPSNSHIPSSSPAKVRDGNVFTKSNSPSKMNKRKGGGHGDITSFFKVAKK